MARWQKIRPRLPYSLPDLSPDPFVQLRLAEVLEKASSSHGPGQSRVHSVCVSSMRIVEAWSVIGHVHSGWDYRFFLLHHESKHGLAVFVCTAQWKAAGWAAKLTA